MQIDESDEQDSNADFSIPESVEFASNLALKSASQCEKHSTQSISTDDGMQIDESDEQYENADESIRETLQHASNVTLETNRFPEKELDPNSSIHLGI
jgi:hypothetical protein